VPLQTYFLLSICRSTVIRMEPRGVNSISSDWKKFLRLEVTLRCANKIIAVTDLRSPIFYAKTR
jgi:hypothetical protein